jgi:OOP family OmpA-OmpF porin
MFKQIAVGAVFALASSLASAAEAPAFYAGVDATSTKMKGFDRDHDNGAGAFIGYAFNEFVAVEAGYHRLADTTVFVAQTPAGQEGVDLRVSQKSISVLGTLPLSNGFSAFGRLGYNRIEEKSGFSLRSYTYTEKKALFGAGVAYAFTPAISGRIEVRKPHSDFTTVAAGVALKF